MNNNLMTVAHNSLKNLQFDKTISMYFFSITILFCHYLCHNREYSGYRVYRVYRVY